MEQKRRVIALGFFDGVHLGHAALLRRVTETAGRLGAVPAAATFDTHPEDVIPGRAHIPLITSPADRGELMKRLYGISDVIVAHFDRRMMCMPWRDFVTEYLVRECGAVHLVAGHDYHFGYKGEGTPRRLEELCAALGLGCDIIPKVELDGVTVSSTGIRALLAQGELERANQFLGHPYCFSGVVAHGKGLGSSLGFPTVNLSFPAGVMTPAFGVYAARARFDGRNVMAVVNVGVRPTVDDSGQANAEGFLLDFHGDLYGRTLRLEFYKFLRPERKFPSLEALRGEVMHNAAQTRSYFEEDPHARDTL